MLKEATHTSEKSADFYETPGAISTSAVPFFLVYLTTFYSNAYYIASNEGCKVNDELERMLKEAVVAYFKVLSQHMQEQER
jgi:hypothetical protein